MTKTIEQLEETACKYWPKDLAEEVATINPIPLLLSTQDVFLSILKCSDKSPWAWEDTINNSTAISASLFLKHLTVLTDIGGERLQRFATDINKIFPLGKFKFEWRGNTYEYAFDATNGKWTNSELNIDKSRLRESAKITKAMRDVATLLIWGSSIIENEKLPEELVNKCVIGQMLGNPTDLETFVRQRYIYVSRITGGSTANDSGHVCERIIHERLLKLLPDTYAFSGHNIPGISHNNKNLTAFDLVIRNKQTDKCCAVEISFQVTTNSVIERKAGLAKSRRKMLKDKGHKVAYIIDGAGNFQRKNAINTILKFSDYTVNFSDPGMQELSDFIKNNV